MKKIILTAILLAFSNPSFSGYGGGEIKRFYVSSDGWVHLGLVSQLPGTCSNWGEHFKFDSTTLGGKNMLSVVMSAKLANKSVNVWYNDTTAPGTNQSNGCKGGVIAILTSIGIP